MPQDPIEREHESRISLQNAYHRNPSQHPQGRSGSEAKSEMASSAQGAGGDYGSYLNSNGVKTSSGPAERAKQLADKAATDTYRPLEKDADTKLGFWAVVFTVTNGMIGPVILVVPYSFYLVGIHGWAMYACAFFVFWFTGHLLYTAQMSKAGTPYQTYPEIGGILGQYGRSVVGLSITIELLGLCAAFVVIVGDNLVKVQPLSFLDIELEKTSWILAFFLVVLPSILMQNYGVLAEMSRIGVLVCFSIPIVVIVNHLLYPVHEAYPPEVIAIEGPSFNWANLPLAMGIVSVAYTTHAIFPTVVAQMSDTDQFPGAMRISFLVVTLFYLLAGTGFYLYGKSTNPQITFNLPVKGQSLISYAIILTILLKFALMLNPVILEIEDQCRMNPNARKWLGLSEGEGSKRPIKIIRILLTSACFVTALVIPYIALIHSAVGVFWSTFVCVVIPCILALHLTGRWSLPQVSVIWGLLLFGLFFMVVGLYKNVLNIYLCYTGENTIKNMCA